MAVAFTRAVASVIAGLRLEPRSALACAVLHLCPWRWDRPRYGAPRSAGACVTLGPAEVRGTWRKVTRWSISPIRVYFACLDIYMRKGTIQTPSHHYTKAFDCERYALVYQPSTAPPKTPRQRSLSSLLQEIGEDKDGDPFHTCDASRHRLNIFLHRIA